MSFSSSYEILRPKCRYIIISSHIVLSCTSYESVLFAYKLHSCRISQDRSARFKVQGESLIVKKVS
jgi:hypothetical protein